VCCDNPNELIEGLKRYIETGYYPADLDNRDFLKLYGTFKDDGMSYKRIYEIVKGLIDVQKDENDK